MFTYVWLQWHLMWYNLWRKDIYVKAVYWVLKLYLLPYFEISKWINEISRLFPWKSKLLIINIYMLWLHLTLYHLYWGNEIVNFASISTMVFMARVNYVTDRTRYLKCQPSMHFQGLFQTIPTFINHYRE